MDGQPEHRVSSTARSPRVWIQGRATCHELGLAPSQQRLPPQPRALLLALTPHLDRPLVRTEPASNGASAQFSPISSTIAIGCPPSSLGAADGTRRSTADLPIGSEKRRPLRRSR